MALEVRRWMVVCRIHSFDIEFILFLVGCGDQVLERAFLHADWREMLSA